MVRSSVRAFGICVVGLVILGKASVSQASQLNIQLFNVSVTPAPTTLSATYSGTLTLNPTISTRVSNIAIDGVHQSFTSTVSALSGLAYLNNGYLGLGGSGQQGFVSINVPDASSPLDLNIDDDPTQSGTEWSSLTIGTRTTYTLGSYGLNGSIDTNTFAGVDVSHWAHRSDVIMTFTLNNIGGTAGSYTLDLNFMDPLTPSPEPASAGLLLAAGGAMVMARGRRR